MPAHPATHGTAVSAGSPFLPLPPLSLRLTANSSRGGVRTDRIDQRPGLRCQQHPSLPESLQPRHQLHPPLALSGAGRRTHQLVFPLLLSLSICSLFLSSLTRVIQVTDVGHHSAGGHSSCCSVRCSSKGAACSAPSQRPCPSQPPRHATRRSSSPVLQRHCRTHSIKTTLNMAHQVTAVQSQNWPFVWDSKGVLRHGLPQLQTKSVEDARQSAYGEHAMSACDVACTRSLPHPPSPSIPGRWQRPG